MSGDVISGAAEVVELDHGVQEFAAQGVEKAERAMLQLPQADCPVVHRFGPGIYIREVFLKAGTLAIGHHQNFAHINTVLYGRVQMVKEDKSTVEVKGPCTFVGQPGRKIGYVLEDTLWQNVYATNIRDIATLEAMYLTKSIDWYAAMAEKHHEDQDQNEPVRKDFFRMLGEYNILAETARGQSENQLDQCSMPDGEWCFKIDNSGIQGVGVFLSAPMSAGMVVGPARTSGLRTPLGRYVNHSPTPNAVMRKDMMGDIDLVLLRNVAGCAGGANGEEVTIDYRQALGLSGLPRKGIE